jgi:hypothetical protein
LRIKQLDLHSVEENRARLIDEACLTSLTKEFVVEFDSQLRLALKQEKKPKPDGAESDSHEKRHWHEIQVGFLEGKNCSG